VVYVALRTNTQNVKNTFTLSLTPDYRWATFH